MQNFSIVFHLLHCLNYCIMDESPARHKIWLICLDVKTDDGTNLKEKKILNLLGCQDLNVCIFPYMYMAVARWNSTSKFCKSIWYVWRRSKIETNANNYLPESIFVYCLPIFVWLVVVLLGRPVGFRFIHIHFNFSMMLFYCYTFYIG